METKNFTDCDRGNFTLSKSIPYQIQIAGQLSQTSDWVGDLDIQIVTDPDGFITTALTGEFDQAGLIGLLRQLYSQGYPLISVNCVPKKEGR